MHDDSVTASGGDGRHAELLEPVAQGYVLRVAERWRGQRLALELGGRGDALLDHDRRAAGGDPRDDLDVAGLLPGGDGRVRPDVGGVKLAGQDSRGLLGAGAERGGLESTRRAQRLREETFLHGDQGGGMRDIAEEAEP